MKVTPSYQFRLALVAWTLVLGLSACSEKRQKELDPTDRPLLGQLLELSEIRILAEQYPDSAQARLDSFLAHTDTTGLSQRIHALWDEPSRGQFLFQALQDSLRAPLKSISHSNDARPSSTPTPKTAKPKP
jgi:hypothetical protein